MKCTVNSRIYYLYYYILILLTHEGPSSPGVYVLLQNNKYNFYPTNLITPMCPQIPYQKSLFSKDTKLEKYHSHSLVLRLYIFLPSMVKRKSWVILPYIKFSTAERWHMPYKRWEREHSTMCWKLCIWIMNFRDLPATSLLWL